MKKLLTALLLVVASTSYTQDFATSFSSTEVVPGIYMVEGVNGFGGGNMGHSAACKPE